MRILIHILSVFLFFLLSPMASAQDTPDAGTQTISALEAEHDEIEKTLGEQNAEFDRLLGLGYGGAGLRHDLAGLVDNVATLQNHLAAVAARIAELGKVKDINPIEPFGIVIRRDAKDGPATRRLAAGATVFFVVDLPYPDLPDETETRLIWTLEMPDGSMSKDFFKSENVVRDGTSGEHVFSVPSTGMMDGRYTVRLEHQEVGAPKHKQIATESFTIKTPRTLHITSVLVDDEKTGDAHKSVLPKDAIPYLFINFTTSKNIEAVTAHLSVIDETTGAPLFQKTGRRVIKPERGEQFIHVGLNPAKYPLREGHSYRFSVQLEDNLNAADTELSPSEVLTSETSVRFRYAGAEEEDEEAGDKDADNDPSVGDETAAVDESGDAGGPTMDTIELGSTNGDDSAWDKIPADSADAGTGETVIADVPDDKSTGDGWDTADAIDDQVVGVSEDQINAMRDQMAEQASNDQSRIDSSARQDFAHIQAEREEQARRKAEARARFAAAMQELAQGLNDVYVASKTGQMPPPYGNSTSGVTTTSNAPLSPTPRGNGGVQQNNLWQKIKDCKEKKYAAARNSGFPIMDPMGPELECRQELSGGGGASTQTIKRCNNDLMTTWDSKADRCVKLSQKVINAAQFGTEYKSGGAGVHTFLFTGRPQSGAQLSIQWDMFGIPDRIVIYFGPRKILDSGMIKHQNSGRLPAYSGGAVKVILTGGGDGTNWNFTLAE